MKILLLPFLFFVSLEWSRATSFETEISECPCCGQSYSRGVLMSWSAFTEAELKAGPPKAMGSCSHCLYTWSGKPDQLTDAQKKRHLENFNRLPEFFKEKDRERLLREEKLSSSGLTSHLLAYSDWAKGGKAEFKPLRWEFFDRKAKVTDDMKEEKAKALKVLVEMKERKKEQKEIEANLTKVTVGYVEDWLRLGDREMEFFSVVWVLWAPDEEFMDSQYTLTEIARHLARMPKENWPGLPAEAATDPVIVESLKYLRGDREWGDDFEKALGLKRPGRTSWLLACAGAKENREALRPFFDLMKEKDAWRLLEMAPDYLRACGREEDLEPLGKILKQWLKWAKFPANDQEVAVYVVGDLEDAMMSLRVKVLLETK